MKVLVTGGAGFIGQHLCRHLLKSGHRVTVLDNFSSQVHGERRCLANDLSSADLIVGDVADKYVMQYALHGHEAVVHLAAETGTGQSMYEVVRYERTNIGGTAVLAEYLANTKGHKIEKVVVASSRAVYGEGSYKCDAHGVQYPRARKQSDMERRRYDPLCCDCGDALAVMPTPETAPLRPESFYALTKQVQEQMILMYARVLGISAFALRYQNVYGPGQSLSNPYTGILAIFCNRAIRQEPLYVFEDGHESRDFVYVADVVRATARCLDPMVTGIEAVNIGSGVAVTIKHVAEEVVDYLSSSSPIEVNHSFRIGDIRSSLADLTKAKSFLDFTPSWSFPVGLREFLSWAAPFNKSESRYEVALSELRLRGLLIGCNQALGS
nr:dTDP-L-rhamnose 4-epimerase [uncultured bacterium]